MQWEENPERMSSESPLEHLKKLKSLKQQGKKATASVIHQELSSNGHSETLNIMLDDLLSPDKLITDTDNIEWCKWIIASGKSPNDFSTQGEFIDLFFIVIRFAICRRTIEQSAENKITRTSGKISSRVTRLSSSHLRHISSDKHKEAHHSPSLSKHMVQRPEKTVHDVGISFFRLPFCSRPLARSVCKCFLAMFSFDSRISFRFQL